MISLSNTEPNNSDVRIKEHEEMGNCTNEEDKEVEADDEFDIGDSDFQEYKEAVHKLLKFRNYKVRSPNGEFRGPFCVGEEEEQGYYRLLEHAVRVAEGSTGSGKHRANHSAMVKYLVIDLANEEKARLITHCKAFEEARYFLGIAKDQSKRVLEQLEMLDSENKRKAALTEEKRKMDDDCDLLYQHNLTEERLTNDELLEAGEDHKKMISLSNTEPNNNDLRINEHEEMGNCINEQDKEVEEFDISDSEFKEYKDAVHKLLKFQNYKVRAPNGEYGCPFCVGEEEKQGYYRLLEHAVRVAEGSTGSRKQRANHSAMAKYLVIDLASEEKTKSTRTIHEEKDETHCKAFEEARYFLGIAKDQSKRVLEQLEMLDFENKERWLNSWKEELDKREVALTEEKRKMDDLIREKNDCGLLYQHNLTEKRLNNDELLEAEKELMKGLENIPSHCRVKFGVKKGEIDEKAFMNACKKRYLLNEAETKVFELLCFCTIKWRDANPRRLLKEKGELLRGLNDMGNKICNAVAAVFEYTGNGNGMELWNFEEDRKASHCEVIRYIFTKWETLQCERDKLIEVIHSVPPRPIAMAYTDKEGWKSEDCQAPKAKNDPNKPKRPPHAFFIFMEDFRKTYQKKNPNNKSVSAVGKAGGDKWKSMSEAEKAPYLAEAEKKKLEYEILMNTYNKKQDSSGDKGSEGSAYGKLEEDDIETCNSESSNLEF